MPPKSKKISLIVFVIVTLLFVGLLPLVLTGWFLSERSGRELRASENRYQIQLVQDKTRQIELFGKRFTSVVTGLSMALELANSQAIISSPQTELKLAAILKENPDLLALSVNPTFQESFSVFRSEALNRTEVDAISADVAASSKIGKVSVGQSKKTDGSGQSVMTFSSDVILNGEKAATIVAVASLQAVSQSVVGMAAANESELWKAGLPITFVVDDKGTAVFYPDPAIASAKEPMTELRIVQEWIESGSQVQSALVPFTAKYGDKNHEMIGAYSTATIGDSYKFGVITMQDEKTALASVGEMKNQTWLISLLFAAFALIVGLIGSRMMTAPLLRLVNAAKLIAGGDFTSRVETKNITEIGTLGETFNLMTDKVEEQIVNLAKAAAENRELFVGTVKALAAAIDGKDKYTRGHSERVARISVAMGKRLGMDEVELDTLRMSALLHDIGKIAIDDSILKKPSALTDSEYEIMKTHPQRGYKIMSQIPAMKDFLPGMYMHHEMVNGKGYPQGLTGDEIPLQAKIISVADTFDAMTIDRPYSKGMDLPSALERIRSFVGTRYQSDVVEALVNACDDGEIANGIVRQMAAIRAMEEESSKAQIQLVA